MIAVSISAVEVLVQCGDSTKACLQNEANFFLCRAVLYVKTVLPVHHPGAIKYFKNHNHKEFNKISAYFKNLCLKLNFDKSEK